jgi:hypothetical protein
MTNVVITLRVMSPMNLTTSGLKDCLDYLQLEATHAPAAAHAGVQAGLQVLETGIRAELDQGGPKLKERKNNKYTAFSVGRRVVAVVFPGLHSVGWMAVTGLEAGGSKQRRRFDAEASALQRAKQYAEQLRTKEGEAEFTIAVTTVADGAEGTLTADREDDDAVQRAWDEGEKLALDAAEAEIRKAMEA